MIRTGNAGEKEVPVFRMGGLRGVFGLFFMAFILFAFLGCSTAPGANKIVPVESDKAPVKRRKYVVGPEMNMSFLKKKMRRKAPKGHFPYRAAYRVFPNICNSYACFSVVVAAYYNADREKMIRLAVFSENGKYLGAYSEVPKAPVSYREYVLYFPRSPEGDRIIFSGTRPPEEIIIDGEDIAFERALRR